MKHHYVPQFYLKGFCDDDGTVLRTFRGPDNDLHERRFAPSATGYEHGLYAMSDAPAAFPSRPVDVVETAVLGPIDNHGAHALERLLASSPS